MGLELRIIKDPCRGIAKARVRSFGLRGGDIGRAPQNFWVLPDPKGYVSGRHCSVEFDDGQYWLRDTSRNGVYVNGAPTPVGRDNRIALNHGDRIRVAEYELLVRLFRDQREWVDGVQRDRLDDADAEPRDASAEVSLARHEVEASETGQHRSVGAHAVQSEPSDGFVETIALPVRATDWASSTHPELVTDDVVTGDPAADDIASDGIAAHDPGTADRAMIARARELVDSAMGRLGQAGRAERQADQLALQRDTAAPHEARAIAKTATFDASVMEHHGVLLAVSDVAALSAYKLLRTRIRRRMTANQWHSIGVSGATEGAGKTLTTINLGVVFAQDTRSPAVIVDLDLHRPKVAVYLGMSFELGLSEYLLGEADIRDIVYATSVPGLAIVPNSRPLPNASELLASPRMTELVRYLESLQPRRTILYDLPPLMMSDDVLVFAPNMDCVLDVVSVGVTPRASIERCKELLAELNVVGVVLNRATGRDKSSHYYY